MSGSPLYADLDIWNAELLSKPLRELSDEDLSRFTSSVLLTWGSETDFKHFLPRILELTAELRTPYDIWFLFERLNDAQWRKWPPAEYNSLNGFILELWKALLQDDSKKAMWLFSEYFHAIAYHYPDFSVLLSAWSEYEDYSATKHLCNYVLEEQHNLFDKNFIRSMTRNTKDIEEFREWLTSNKTLARIERAFYKFEKDELADKLSWVEKILSLERVRDT